MNRPAATILMVALGAALMAACSTGTLWFDEILSLQWAKSAKNPWQLVELYRHDNNHPLNSLWIMAVGEGRPPWAYRMLSIASGIASLVLIHRIARRLSPRFAWIPLALSATSFPLILYSSEARGYAPAIACLLGAYVVITGHGRSVWRVPLFWFLCTAAVLAHGTALTILAAMGTASLLRSILEKQSPAAVLGNLSLWFGVPLLATAAYWNFFLRQMIIAGGPEYTLPAVLSHFFGYAFGIPGAGSLHSATAFAGLALLASAIAFGRFPDPATRWFFAGATAVFPALSLLAADTTYLYFRYFLVCLPFVYLLAAPMAERVAECRRTASVAALALVSAAIVGQIPRLWTLATQGRGSYLAALEKIASDSDPGKTIVSNNDMQVGLVLGHFRARLPALEPLRFTPNSAAAQTAPHWILYTTQEDPPVPPQSAIELHGKIYQNVSFHRSAPVSGAHWAVYKIHNATPP
jgi:hypothetical protein